MREWGKRLRVYRNVDVQEDNSLGSESFENSYSSFDDIKLSMSDDYTSDEDDDMGKYDVERYNSYDDVVKSDVKNSNSRR